LGRHGRVGTSVSGYRAEVAWPGGAADGPRGCGLRMDRGWATGLRAAHGPRMGHGAAGCAWTADVGGPAADRSAASVAGAADEGFDVGGRLVQEITPHRHRLLQLALADERLVEQILH